MLRASVSVCLGLGAALSIFCAQNAPQIHKTTPSATSPDSGAKMYNEYCASCHGKDGKGDGPAAAALTPRPETLTTIATRNGGKFPDAKIQNYIEGVDHVAAHGSRDMPVWGNVFRAMHRGQDDLVRLRIANLKNYVKSLQAK